MSLPPPLRPHGGDIFFFNLGGAPTYSPPLFPSLKSTPAGGVGVPGGTVVITTHALSGELREEFCIPIGRLGRIQSYVPLYPTFQKHRALFGVHNL